MILRLGSKGAFVIEVQKFLGLTQTGSFDSITESAVREWQKSNGLTSDGIVGPKTWNAMGLATTDIKESIDSDTTGFTFKREYLPSREYMAGPVPKRWIFLHHTAGWNDPFATIKAWGRDTRGSVATEWVLGGQKINDNNDTHDGVLVQAFPEGGYGWHLGTGNSAMHRESVGIEVCNFGYLTKGGYTKDGKWVALKPNSYYTYVGTEADPSQLVTLSEPFRGYSVWHRYSDKQISVLKDLILYTSNRYNIDPRKGLVEQIHKLGAHKAFDLCDVRMAERTVGLWNHTNVIRGKFDMFPQQELVDMLLTL